MKHCVSANKSNRCARINVSYLEPGTGSMYLKMLVRTRQFRRMMVPPHCYRNSKNLPPENLATECENLVRIGFITSGIGLYTLYRSRIRCFLAAKRAKSGFDSRRRSCSHGRLSAEMPTLTKVLARRW